MKRVIFYQNINKKEGLKSWKEGAYFGHTLYGMTHFSKYGIDAFFFNDKINSALLKIKSISRVDLRLIYHPLYLLLKIRSYDIVYAPYAKGLELLILLRSWGLFNKQIVIYSHGAILNPKNNFKKWLIKLYYKGVDKIIFFSNIHYNNSIKNYPNIQSKFFKIDWGPDVDFFDQFNKTNNINNSIYFISNGKSKRDYNTLVEAFSKTNFKLKLFLTSKSLIESLSNKYRVHNIEYIFLPANEVSPGILAKEVSKSFCVVMCTKPTNGLHGITGLYEAMALKKPVIITRNNNIDIEIDKEEIGITVEVGDVEGWIKALNLICNNPTLATKYGSNGRKLCETKYNLDLFSEQVSRILNDL